MRNAANRTLTFKFTNGNVFGSRGPAVSSDGGATWQWLGAETVKENSFQYRFGAAAKETRFCFAIPYLQKNLESFLKSNSDNPHLVVEALGKTPKEWTIHRLRVGHLNGRPKRRVLIVCRHHACESLASFAVEGIIEAVLAETEDGSWFRNSTEFWVLPFMDKDGVEDGDQGKLRRPYDHWLDYKDESRYASTRLLRKAMQQNGGPPVTVALDMHCPYIRDTRIYFAGGPTGRNQVNTDRLCRLLEQVQTGALRYQPEHNLPFGTGWNAAGTYAGRKSFALWAEELPGNRIATTVELPYASVGSAAVTAKTARAFGRDLARALRLFLDGI